jgi:hypothetical protein
MMNWNLPKEPTNQPGAWGFNRNEDKLFVSYGPNIGRLMRGNRGRFRMLPFKRQPKSPFPIIAGGARVYYRQYQEPAGFTVVTDQTQISGTSETLLWPYQFTGIPAQGLVPGQQVEIKAFGVATTPASAATTITLNPRWGTTTGGVTLGISNTSATVVASQTGVPWFLNFLVTMRTVSDVATSSTVKGAGTCCGITMGGSATIPSVLVMGGTAATVDTVSTEALVFGATLGGSASWFMTTQGIALEVLN